MCHTAKLPFTAEMHHYLASFITTFSFGRLVKYYH